MSEPSSLETPQSVGGILWHSVASSFEKGRGELGVFFFKLLLFKYPPKRLFVFFITVPKVVIQPFLCR